MTAAELVERVAVNAIPGSSHEDCLRIARAAVTETLAAIREPTAMMIEAGDAALYQGDVIDPAHVFRTMIDALAAEIAIAAARQRIGES